MESLYLLRYGAMGRIAPARCDEPRALQRGEPVVVATARGQELAEILVPVARALVPDEIPTRILRGATPEDLDRASRQQGQAADWPRRCQEIIEKVAPALEVVDIEVLLDGTSLVAYVLGELPADLPAVRAAVRMRHDLDLQLEPLGSGMGEEEVVEAEEAEAASGCGSCESKKGGGSGCSGCGVKRRVAAWAASREA